MPDAPNKPNLKEDPDLAERRRLEEKALGALLARLRAQPAVEIGRWTEEERAWIDMAPVGRELGSAEFRPGGSEKLRDTRQRRIRA